MLFFFLFHSHISYPLFFFLFSFFSGTLNENGQYLLKACNLVISKSLDHTNRTYCLCVLLCLLCGCLREEDKKSSTFVDFVLKCLMKLTMELKGKQEMLEFEYVLKGFFFVFHFHFHFHFVWFLTCLVSL